MCNESVTLERAVDVGENVASGADGEDRLPYVEALLQRNDLPADDLESEPGCFYVAFDGDDPVGIGGLEVHGRDGLLRSVVVEQSLRGRGLGTALAEELEELAAAAGIEMLYLLTTTVADFFAERGYVEVARAEAPPSIRETSEFAELCPASATCMRKSL